MGNSAPPSDLGDLPPSAAAFQPPAASFDAGAPPKKPAPSKSAAAPPRKSASSASGTSLPTFHPPYSRGLKNMGNTCYGSSVLQSLFSTPGFRVALFSLSSSHPHLFHPPPSLVERPPSADQSSSSSSSTTLVSSSSSSSTSRRSAKRPPSDSASTSLLVELQRVFLELDTAPAGTVVVPEQFFAKVRGLNSLFCSLAHQDSHEFLIFLLNSLSETLRAPSSPTNSSDTNSADIIKEFFEGQLSHETRCCSCETITSVDEAFLNLSLDIQPNVSLLHCLRQFCFPELLSGANKFFCNYCSCLQEAQKRVRIKKEPRNLIVHLKRFKFNERLQRLGKLSYRVYFSSELRLDDVPDRLYRLYAVVVHLGHGPNSGHYVAITKCPDQDLWVLFDDHLAKPFPFDQFEAIFGSPLTNQSGSCGYLLFYSRVDS